MEQLVNQGLQVKWPLKWCMDGQIDRSIDQIIDCAICACCNYSDYAIHFNVPLCTMYLQEKPKFCW